MWPSFQELYHLNNVTTATELPYLNDLEPFRLIPFYERVYVNYYFIWPISWELLHSNFFTWAISLEFLHTNYFSWIVSLDLLHLDNFIWTDALQLLHLNYSAYEKTTLEVLNLNYFTWSTSQELKWSPILVWADLSPAQPQLKLPTRFESKVFNLESRLGQVQKH